MLLKEELLRISYSFQDPISINFANFRLNLAVDPTGLIATGTLPTPPVDGTGYTATISLTLSDNTVVSDTSDPFDIVQDPDNVDNFTIQESAL